MTDETKSPADLLLDACVFAPLGFALEARKLLPTLADRGRNHVKMARVVGQFAVTRLGRELGPLQGEAGRWLGPLLAPFGFATEDLLDVAPTEPTTTAEERSGRTVQAEELVIPGYDALAASQVIPRLSGMTPNELADVAAYEGANRGRRTILHKVEQLLAGN